MTVAEYMVDFLAKKGVSDIFGIPGGVALPFLYAAERNQNLKVHLSYHEQCAAFEASGCAQTSGNIGVCYGTRGPGITNMLTAIADAYYDSIPLFVVTSHSHVFAPCGMRIEEDQEMDLPALVRSTTKYAARIDDINDIGMEIQKAYASAMCGRKGPVLVDVLSSLWNKEILNPSGEEISINGNLQIDSIENIISEIKGNIEKSRHPILLIGDGIHQSKTEGLLKEFVENNNIPVLSSRYGQDVIPESKKYFGYIGSHGLRYGNFILSKTDLIIALGNRMSFPVKSKSFAPLFEKCKVIRIDIDKTEFERTVPNSKTFCADIGSLLNELNKIKLEYEAAEKWLGICTELKERLFEKDVEPPVRIISNIIKKLPSDVVIANDVGNNEFWTTRAYAFSKSANRILFSKSFGALGCGLPKAIGAHYATKKPAICFVGDQGFQMNIQELELVAKERLPVAIVVLNNSSSGMIRSRQLEKFGGKFLHTTFETGYGSPNFELVAKAYGIRYLHLTEDAVFDMRTVLQEPCIVEMQVDESFGLSPNLPVGNPCQKLVPKLSVEEYEYCEKL